MSKLLKAKQTSMTQEAYSIQVEKIRPLQPLDPELTEATVKALTLTESMRAKAHEDALQIIQGAQQEADLLLARERERVEAQLLAEKEAALQRGYEDGLQQGQLAVEEQFRNAFAEMEQLVQSVTRERQKYLNESETLIADLAIAVAEKIIQQEISVDNSFVLNVVRSALEEIHDAGQIEVRVHPDDYEWVNRNRAGLRKEVPGQTELLVIPDRGVATGGCVLQTAYGNVDARIDTQLEEVRKALQEVAASLLS